MGGHAIGARVGAILGADQDTKVLKFLGFGTYAGDFVPREAVGFMADGLIEYEIPNPRIDLDDGHVVYGCECWWGSETAIRQQLDGYREKGWAIVETSIAAVREEFRKDAAGAE